MNKVYILITTLFISSCTLVGIRNSEEARYDLLLEENNIQVRNYEKVLIAETQTQGNYKESSNAAFKRLANYIFGDNQSQQDISMTTPVMQQQENEEIAMTVPVYQQKGQASWTMRFVLPAKYNLETIPLPNDPNVNVYYRPEKKIASIRYSGFITNDKIEQHSQQLIKWLEEKQFKILSAPYSAAYDPPWTIPFLRRNEVHIEIE